MFPFEGVNGQEPTFPPENFHAADFVLHFQLKFLICSWFFSSPASSCISFSHSSAASMSTATFSPTSPRRETHNSAGLAFQNPGHRFVLGRCLLEKVLLLFVDFYLSCEGGVQLFNCIYKFRWFLIQSDPKLWLEGLQSEPAKDTPGTMIINMERMKWRLWSKDDELMITCQFPAWLSWWCCCSSLLAGPPSTFSISSKTLESRYPWQWQWWLLITVGILALMMTDPLVVQHRFKW